MPCHFEIAIFRKKKHNFLYFGVTVTMRKKHKKIPLIYLNFNSIEIISFWDVWQWFYSILVKLLCFMVFCFLLFFFLDFKRNKIKQFSFVFLIDVNLLKQFDNFVVCFSDRPCFRQRSTMNFVCLFCFLSK